MNTKEEVGRYIAKKMEKNRFAFYFINLAFAFFPLNPAGVRNILTPNRRQFSPSSFSRSITARVPFSEL